MRYLLDTNILLIYLRESDKSIDIDNRFDPLGKTNIPIISVVSLGEIRSLAIRNRWGKRRMQQLNELLHQLVVTDIHVEEIIQLYAEIDAFSQGLLPDKPLGMTARNMSKNDLWIAATAAAANLCLLTTDKDFGHLQNVFIDLVEIHI
jgi:predicted nucleic acid-binding protein